MDLEDYLDSGLGRGGHRGGHRHGGGRHHGGGGWRGGGWGYGWPALPYYPEPIVLEVERPPALPMQYVGIPANTVPMGCRAQIAPALWRCGNTTYYDVSRYELRATGLVAKGLAGLRGLRDLDPPVVLPLPWGGYSVNVGQLPASTLHAQQWVNAFLAPGQAPIVTDGRSGPETIAALERLRARILAGWGTSAPADAALPAIILSPSLIGLSPSVYNALRMSPQGMAAGAPAPSVPIPTPAPAPAPTPTPIPAQSSGVAGAVAFGAGALLVLYLLR